MNQAVDRLASTAPKTLRWTVPGRERKSRQTAEGIAWWYSVVDLVGADVSCHARSKHCLCSKECMRHACRWPADAKDSSYFHRLCMQSAMQACKQQPILSGLTG